MTAAVHLLNPKYPMNVGGVLRACSVLGAESLSWTGYRVEDKPMSSATPISKRKWRLPREERMKAYRHVEWSHVDDTYLDQYLIAGFTPVCVELFDTSEPLTSFVHPDKPVYVFGPEDGSVNKAIRVLCHRFVYVPARSCLNLAACVNVVLYDRIAKDRALADRLYVDEAMKDWEPLQQEALA